MTNCIFFVVILSLFLNFSFGAVNYSGVDRTFQLMFKGVLENSFKAIDNDGNPCDPYFDKTLLEENAEKYFSLNLPKYVTNYVTAYYYFNPNDYSYCTSSYCKGVRISLKADINFLFHYEKGRNFYIYSNNVK